MESRNTAAFSGCLNVLPAQLGNAVNRLGPKDHIHCPVKSCLELKSFKMYLLAYHNSGIFQENPVNRILADIVKNCKPKWCVVRVELSSPGGMSGTIEARYKV